MTGRLAFVIFVISIFTSGISKAQVGTEFWLAPPEATSGHVTDSPPLLRVATGASAATVTVSMPAEHAFNGGAPLVQNVQANSSYTFNLSAYKELLETKTMNTVLNTGLKVNSNQPITAYYELNTTKNPYIWALKGPNILVTEFYVP